MLVLSYIIIILVTLYFLYWFVCEKIVNYMNVNSYHKASAYADFHVNINNENLELSNEEIKKAKFHIEEIKIKFFHLHHFNFPNNRMELEARISNSGTDLSKTLDSMEIKQYCKY